MSVRGIILVTGSLFWFCFTLASVSGKVTTPSLRLELIETINLELFLKTN